MRRHLTRVILALGALSVVASQLLPVKAGGAPALEIHKVDSVSFTPGPDKPIFMLALGLDGGRPGIDGDRSDAIHLIGINPATHSGTMLNIPRDSYVAIPGHGQSKINDAYALGGPGLAANAVEALTGADVSFVLGTRFGPFEQMVNDAGGVDVDVPLAMKDRFSGADFPKGRVHMNGSQALSFARNRHIEGGDLRRSEDQGLLILSALTKLRAENLGPTGTARYLAILGKYVGMTGVSPVELYRLGRLALSIDPAAVRSVTMPSRIGSVGAQSVVFVGAGAVSLFEDMRDDAVLQSH